MIGQIVDGLPLSCIGFIISSPGGRAPPFAMDSRVERDPAERERVLLPFQRKFAPARGAIASTRLFLILGNRYQILAMAFQFVTIDFDAETRSCWDGDLSIRFIDDDGLRSHPPDGAFFCVVQFE